MRQFIAIAASYLGSRASDPRPSPAAATATLPRPVSRAGQAAPQSATVTPAASTGTRWSGLLIWALASAGLMCIAASWPQVKALGTPVAGIDGGNGGWLLVGVTAIAALLFYAWALARAAAVTWPPPQYSPVAEPELGASAANCEPLALEDGAITPSPAEPIPTTATRPARLPTAA